MLSAIWICWVHSQGRSSNYSIYSAHWCDWVLVSTSKQVIIHHLVSIRTHYNSNSNNGRTAEKGTEWVIVMMYCWGYNMEALSRCTYTTHYVFDKVDVYRYLSNGTTLQAKSVREKRAALDKRSDELCIFVSILSCDFLTSHLLLHPTYGFSSCHRRPQRSTQRVVGHCCCCCCYIAVPLP